MDDLCPPAEPLRSNRLLLRPFTVNDAAAVAASCQDPDIHRFTMMPADMTEEMARTWIERGLEWWPRGIARFAIAMVDADEAGSDVCIGQIGVQFEWRMNRAEAFYWLDARFRGQGVTSEALELVTKWAFDFDIKRLQLVTHLDNPGSHGVAIRCGFQREGILRAWEPVHGEQADVVMWSRLASD